MRIRPNDSGNTKKFDNGFHVPQDVQNILMSAQHSICLPYELSIIEIDRILTAIKTVAGTSEITVKLSKGSDEWTFRSPSAFNIMNFIFDTVYQLPTAICILIHEPTSSTVYWDDEERFVVIAGARSFCDHAFPHSRDVLEYFYVQSTISEFENEDMLRECFTKITSGL